MRKIYWGGIYTSFFIASVILSNVVVNAENVPSSGNPDINAVIERLNTLQQRVDSLEKKVIKQDNVIKRQRKVLEKAAEVIPGLKAMLLPPEPKFLVEEITLSGATLFAAEDFEPILKKYRGKKLGMRDLKKVADELTTFYRSKGYVTSLAYAPTQEISDNTVEFKIVEGRVGEINIEEGEYCSKETVKGKFLVKKGEILNYKKLEKSVNRINKQPGRTMKVVLLPGEEPGTSSILLKQEKEQKPWHFSLEYDNRGTEYTGENRFGVGFAHNNFSKHDDILSAKFKMGEDSDVYSASLDYNFPISSYDTRLGFYGAHCHADVGGQFKILSPEGKATAFGIYLAHPLFDRDFSSPAALNLGSNLTLGLDAVSVYNQILGEETSHDELRIVKAGIGFNEKDSLGRTFISNEVRVGLPNCLGSMDEDDVNASRLDAGGKFVKYVGSLTRVNRLPFSCLLVTSAKGQIADNPLVNSEQFSLGGADSIRGFPENEYLADYGWASTFELRTPAFVFPKEFKLPRSKENASLRDAMQFVYFVDFGEGFLKNPAVGEEKNKFLVGAGLGLRFEFYKHFRGRVDWGFPVGSEDASDGSENRVHIGIEAEF